MDKDLYSVAFAACDDFDRIDRNGDRKLSYLEILNYKKSEPDSSRVQSVASLLENNYETIAKIDPGDRNTISKHELEAVLALASGNGDAVRALVSDEARESTPYDLPGSEAKMALTVYPAALVLAATLVPGALAGPPGLFLSALATGTTLAVGSMMGTYYSYREGMDYYEQRRNMVSKLKLQE